MTKRAFRPMAILVSMMLAGAVPAQAGPVQMAEVLQIIGAGGGTNNASLQLRYVGQEGGAQQEGTSSPASGQQTPGNGAAAQVQVQTQEEGEIIVEESCNCPDLPFDEIALAGRKFPLPLLALGGIPFLFIPRGDNPPDVPPTPPTPTPPNTPVPEPATLLLFGSGLAALGARARRRYARTKAAGGESVEITEG